MIFLRIIVTEKRLDSLSVNQRLLGLYECIMSWHMTV